MLQLARMNSLTVACLLLSCFLSASSAVLNCNEQGVVTCPGSVVTCQCVEATARLQWTVTPGDGCIATYDTFITRPPVGAVNSLCDDGHTVVLDAESTNSIGTIKFSSSLNITVQEDLTVTCRDMFGAESATLQVARPPSPPVNLRLSPDITADNGAAVRLEWSPPEDDGGANVTSYQVLVDGSLQVTTSCTVTVIELSPTEHSVQVRARNCAGLSASLTAVVDSDVYATSDSSSTSSVDTTSDPIGPTTAYSSAPTPPADSLVRLDTGAVAGVVVTVLVVMVLVYTFGLLTGALAQRKRSGGGGGKCPPTSASPGEPNAAAGQLVPTYEEVLLPATSIPLQENASYAQL